MKFVNIVKQLSKEGYEVETITISKIWLMCIKTQKIPLKMRGLGKGYSAD